MYCVHISCAHCQRLSASLEKGTSTNGHIRMYVLPFILLGKWIIILGWQRGAYSIIMTLRHIVHGGLSCMLHKNTSLGVILRDNGRIVSMKLLLMKSRGLQPLSVVLRRRAQPRPLRTTNGALSEERRCKNCTPYLTPFLP